MSDTDRANLTVAADVPPAERAALAVELAAAHAADALRELAEGAPLSWAETRPSVLPLIALFQQRLIESLAASAGPGADRFRALAAEVPPMVELPVEVTDLSTGSRHLKALKVRR